MKDSREKIIDSAKKLIHLKGFQGTSIDDIIKSSRVTKSNLYYHFKSKEEIGLLVLEMIIKEYEDTLFAATLGDRTFTPEARLNKYYRMLIYRHKKLNFKMGCPLGNLALEMSDINEKFRKRISEFFGYWQKQIQICIKEGIKEKEFRDDVSARALALLIISHTEGAIMMTKAHRSATPLSLASKTLLKLLKK